jgi:hypothetical protein
VFLVLLVLFLVFVAWLLPKLWRLAKRTWNALLPQGPPAEKSASRG